MPTFTLILCDSTSGALVTRRVSGVPRTGTAGFSLVGVYDVAGHKIA